MMDRREVREQPRRRNIGSYIAGTGIAVCLGTFAASALLWGAGRISGFEVGYYASMGGIAGGIICLASLPFYRTERRRAPEPYIQQPAQPAPSAPQQVRRRPAPPAEGRVVVTNRIEHEGALFYEETSERDREGRIRELIIHPPAQNPQTPARNPPQNQRPQNPAQNS